MTSPVNVGMLPTPGSAGTAVFFIAMWGMVVSLWIALIGLFVIAIVHDGQSVPTVVDAASKLVSAVILALTGLGGMHIYVSRNQATPPPPPPPPAA